jgi:hypothetical protein
MNKLIDLFNLFRKGSELSNSEVWKDRGNATTLLVPFIMLLVKVAGDYGYGVQLSTEEATSIAFGIVALVQFVIHNVTSKRAGILPEKADKPDSPSNSEISDRVPAEKSVQSEPKTDDQNKSIYFG